MRCPRIWNTRKHFQEVSRCGSSKLLEFTMDKKCYWYSNCKVFNSYLNLKKGFTKCHLPLVHLYPTIKSISFRELCSYMCVAPSTKYTNFCHVRNASWSKLPALIWDVIFPTVYIIWYINHLFSSFRTLGPILSTHTVHQERERKIWYFCCPSVMPFSNHSSTFSATDLYFKECILQINVCLHICLLKLRDYFNYLMC